MTPTDLIILVFGIIFIIYFLKNKENFNLTDSLGNQVNKLSFETNYGMNYAPLESHELVNKMQDVLDKEKIVRKQAVNDYQNDVLKAMNIPEFYQPAIDIPFDVKRHEYKFEKNPNKVIDEMTERGDELELRKIFNNVVKDFKHIEPVNQIVSKDNSVDNNNYSYLDGPRAKIESEELEPINGGSYITSFFRYN